MNNKPYQTGYEELDGTLRADFGHPCYKLTLECAKRLAKQYDADAIVEYAINHFDKRKGLDLLVRAKKLYLESGLTPQHKPVTLVNYWTRELKKEINS